MNSRAFMSQNHSILNTDTLEEGQISINFESSQKHLGKHKNFLEALRYVKSNKNNMNSNDSIILPCYSNQVNTTTEEGLNVSEYSKTNAHFSREENVLLIIYL